MGKGIMLSPPFEETKGSDTVWPTVTVTCWLNGLKFVAVTDTVYVPEGTLAHQFPLTSLVPAGPVLSETEAPCTAALL